MSIDSTKPIDALVATQGIVDVTKNSVNKAAQSTSRNRTFSAGTQVTLSRAAKYFNSASAHDVDMDRVESIKNALNRGELHIDAGKIADALLSGFHSVGKDD